MSQYLYLHGFASSPKSQKALYFAQSFQSEFNISLHVPDLCPEDFTNFTISSAIARAGSFLENTQQSWVIIGSSLGGLIATYLAEYFEQVERLILLAPAFDFVSIWSESLGEQVLSNWKKDGYYPVYHHGYKKDVMLSYQFIVDAREVISTPITRKIPTLIMHGISDETIAIEVSRRYAADKEWVNLIEFDSDHSLSNVLPEIWQAIKNTIPALS